MLMNFEEFANAFTAKFAEMSDRYQYLYMVQVNPDDLYNHYLNSFLAGCNELYRVRTEHDCNTCRHAIKHVGMVVALQDGVMHSVWDLQLTDPGYQAVANQMAAYVKAAPVCDVFVTRFNKFGCRHTHSLNPDGTVQNWDHLEAIVPRKHLSEDADSVRAQYRDQCAVFRRSLEELSLDSVDTVLELIASNTLYRGQEWKASLSKFQQELRSYLPLSVAQRNWYAWERGMLVGQAIARIRNHSIGVLLQDLTSGMDLEQAVRRYEQIVAPTNYKRPNAIFTEKMLNDAKKTIEALGYARSLPRRFATLDDITANNILFLNKDVAPRVAGGIDLLESLGHNVARKPKKFERAEEMPIEAFVKNVLPTATDLEVYVETRHAKNLVSLIAPVHDDAKSMFRWNNAFSWSYTGNITDSVMRERVKAAGGKVDGVLRFSIQWNDDPNQWDQNDLDAHCIVHNNKEHIYFGSKFGYITKGELDVDIIHPEREQAAVENIVWTNRNTMLTGPYEFLVQRFTNRGGQTGFRAEIEVDGQLFSYDYHGPFGRCKGFYDCVDVATVQKNADGTFSVTSHIDSSVASKTVWNVTTEQFVPVSVVMYSPNYWDDQQHAGAGHRHYFFMLKDCINSEQPNGFYNEFLKQELVQHKRVFEALGAKAHVAESDQQLSGIGFSETKRDSLVVKVKGQIERVIKVVF